MLDYNPILFFFLCVLYILHFMKRFFAVLFFILALAFIWTHSTMSAETSSAESEWVMNLIKPFLELIVGKGNVSSAVVRKMAHYFEFAFLGFFTLFFFQKENRRTLVQILLSFVACIMVGFIDESIQMFTGRGPAIMDVWIDFAGSFVGILVALLC